jgi:hypothetical protein
MLAIEIFTMIPIFIGSGIALGLLSGVADFSSVWKVEFWAEYGKRTRIGYLDISMFNFKPCIEAIIDWKYWAFFDLWIPSSDLNFNMDDIFKDLSTKHSAPKLHCNFIPIENTSIYNFYTTYSDFNGNEPEYVKLHLIAPNETSFEFTMEPHPVYENYTEEEMSEIYKSGVVYNKTIDFKGDFNYTQAKGQWFYYFASKDDSGQYSDESKFPSDYSYEKGPYIGNYSDFLQYSFDSSEITGEECEAFNYTVVGVALDEGIDPDEVYFNVLLPNGTIHSYEMTLLSSETLFTGNNYSIFYNKTQYTYFISMNYSQYYDFDTTLLLCYYYSSSMTDGNESVLFLEDSFYKLRLFCDIGIWGLGGSGGDHDPKFIKYSIWDMLWDRKWGQEAGENLGYCNGERLIQINDEHILRVKVWIEDPDGGHEETYDQCGFEFVPELKLIKKDWLGNTEDTISLDMKFIEYDHEESADVYFIDLFGDGEYSTTWDHDDVEECDFRPGSWIVEFEVTDNQSNTVNSGECQTTIWHCGSYSHMWQVWFGGSKSVINYDSSGQINPMLYLFGVLEPIITLCGFGSAALAQIAQPSGTYGRAIAMVTTLVSSVLKLGAFASFLADGDTGAILGLAFNSLTNLLIVQLIANWLTTVQQLTNFKFNYKTLNNKNLGFMKLFTVILLVLRFITMIFVNPRKIISIGILTAFLSLAYMEHAGSGKTHKTAYFYALALIFTFGSLVADYLVDGMDDLIDWTSLDDLSWLSNEWLSLPTEVLGLLIQSFGVGTILSYMQLKTQHNSKQGTVSDNPFGKLTTRNKGNPVINMVKFYGYMQALVGIVCIGAFYYKTGLFYVTWRQFENIDPI